MIENGIQNRLSGFAGLIALVGTRIYASHLPQTPTFPCVAYRKVGGMPRQLLSASTTMYDTDIEIGCFAKSYDSANSVAEQVVSALHRYSGTNDSVVIVDCVLNNISNDYESELEIFEVTLSFKISHRGL